ncbi:MAG: hypothetical protein ACHQ2Z_12780 [Elusimicrobiota bacterium]
MRRLLLAAAVLSGAACASPAPCTLALCPWHDEGATYRVSGWSRPVTVAPGTPAVPIVADSTVEVLSGRVAFTNRRAVVVADEGSSFRFDVSGSSAPAASITLTAGSVSVALSSTSAASPLTPGLPYILPVPKK